MTNHDLNQIPVASNLPWTNGISRPRTGQRSLLYPWHRTRRAALPGLCTSRKHRFARPSGRGALAEWPFGNDSLGPISDLRSPDDGSDCGSVADGFIGPIRLHMLQLVCGFINPENDLSGITDSRRADRHHHTHRRCVPVRSDRGLVRISAFRNPAGSRTAKPTQVE